MHLTENHECQQFFLPAPFTLCRGLEALTGGAMRAGI